NFSPEIEDAVFVRHFDKPVMIIAAAEESAGTLAENRGDALCGLLSATLAIGKRDLLRQCFFPANPLVDSGEGAAALDRFRKIARILKGIRSSTIGLFGPRPRDFETCNYNISSLHSLGVEVEELGFFDLQNEVRRVEKEENTDSIINEMQKEMETIPDVEFGKRLAVYERALLNFRDNLKLSGAATQCWAEQEFALRHVPCYVNARLAARGFPVACENDAYSLAAELVAQYASDQSVTILDLNHSIPLDVSPKLSRYNISDCIGLFHCGNTDPSRLVCPAMKHQVIMKRLMEPENEPDITRGTIEGQIKASPMTMVQVHGAGDSLRAFVAEGEMLDLDPKTFGCTGTAHIPGFQRFYRYALLGRFHHHAAIAFNHCGSLIYDALRLCGIETIYTPLPDSVRYPGENPFGK
ncbi:MAG: fucose isomerase, partial [Chitinivibrionales bacterium]|nr:fucose isomerase [Chitinivibrionales bacterium]